MNIINFIIIKVIQKLRDKEYDELKKDILILEKKI